MTKIAIDPPPLLNIGTDAVERILAAAGRDIVPIDFDKKGFADALNTLMHLYVNVVVSAARAESRKQKKGAIELRNAAVKLRKLIDQEHISHLVSFHRAKIDSHRAQCPERWGMPNPYPEDVRVTMDRLVEDTEYFLGVRGAPANYPPWPAPAVFGSDQPPFTALIGELENLFKLRFGQELTLWRNKGKVVGAFVDVVEQVLSECRVLHNRKPYSRESIAKARSDARAAAREAAANVGEN